MFHKFLYVFPQPLQAHLPMLSELVIAVYAHEWLHTCSIVLELLNEFREVEW